MSRQQHHASERAFTSAVLDSLVERIALQRGTPTRRVRLSDDGEEFLDGDALWGLGFDGPLPHLPRVRVRSVRGPWTANVLATHGIDVPLVFGDAGLLVAKYFPELRELALAEGSRAPLVMFGADANPDRASMPSGTRFISDAQPPAAILRAIAQSQLVVSSCVTAVAIAESLGVPARLFATLEGGSFAHRDYLLGTRRPFASVADSASAAIAEGGYEPPRFDHDLLDRSFPLAESAADALSDAPERYSISVQDREKWAAALEVKVDAAAASLLAREVAVELESAQRSGEPDLASTVERLAHRLQVVEPHLVAHARGGDARLLAAVGGGNLAHATAALATREVAFSARVLGVRRLYAEMQIEISVTGTPEHGRWPEIMTLILQGLSGRWQVMQRIRLFAQQRRQWRVDLTFLVSLADLAGDGNWGLALQIGNQTLAVTDGQSVLLHDPAQRIPSGDPAVVSVIGIGEAG